MRGEHALRKRPLNRCVFWNADATAATPPCSARRKMRKAWTSLGSSLVGRLQDSEAMVVFGGRNDFNHGDALHLGCTSKTRNTASWRIG